MNDKEQEFYGSGLGATIERIKTDINQDSSDKQNNNTTKPANQWDKGELVPGAKPWLSGQSGNLAGRPKDIKYISEAIRDLIKSDPELLKDIVLKLAKEASKGNVQAFKEFADRGEGKVADKIEGTENPVTIILRPARDKDATEQEEK